MIFRMILPSPRRPLFSGSVRQNGLGMVSFPVIYIRPRFALSEQKGVYRLMNTGISEFVPEFIQNCAGYVDLSGRRGTAFLVVE